MLSVKAFKFREQTNDEEDLGQIWEIEPRREDEWIPAK